MNQLYTLENAQNKTPYISGIETISTGQANRILKMSVWDRQRSVRKQTVNNYARIMSSGNWVENSVIKFCVLDGMRYLVDGQHRLFAVVESNTSQQFYVIYEYVSDMSKISDIYASIDRGTARTPFDQLHALYVDDLFGMNQTELNMVAASVKFVEANFKLGKKNNNIKHSAAELSELIEKYQDAAQTSIEIYREGAGHMKKIVKRRAVFSVMIASTHQYKNNKTVCDFWQGVLLDDGLKNGDPRKVAVTHLVSSITKGNSGVMSGGSRVVTIGYQARYMANCLNAYMENRQITKTLVRDDFAPLRIGNVTYK